MALPSARGRRLAAAAVALVIVAAAVATGIFLAHRSSEPPTTAEVIRTLIEDPDAGDRVEAAVRLVAARDCSIARQVARLGAQGEQARTRSLLLRDRYAALYRNGGPPGRATAVRCLAEFDDRESAAVVADALADPAPRVRDAAARSLPAMKQSAPLVVERLVTTGMRSPDASADAISRALAGIGEPAVPALVQHVVDSTWAANTLLQIGEPAARPLRAAFRRSRGERQAAFATVLLELRDVAPEVVDATVPEIVSKMMARLGRQMQPDFSAAEVLANVGAPAVPELVRLARTPYLELSGPERNIRSSAVLILTSMGEKDAGAVAPLLVALRRKDYDYIADLHLFYIGFGLAERELIAALQAHGDTEIVLDFLTSGNRRLEAAARDYARRNGYTITGDPRSTGLFGTWRQHRLGSG